MAAVTELAFIIFIVDSAVDVTHKIFKADHCGIIKDLGSFAVVTIFTRIIPR